MVENKKYNFNYYVEEPNKYLEMSYMSQLISNTWKQITKVLKIELYKKDHIKFTIVAEYIYYDYFLKSKNKPKALITINYYYRGEIQVIFSENNIDKYINLIIAKIDININKFMKLRFLYYYLHLTDFYKFLYS